MSLAEALTALDCAVTLVNNSRGYLTLRDQPWVDNGELAMARFASGERTYALSDGVSRLTYSVANRWCALTRESSTEARDNFENALHERRALEALVTAWLDGELKLGDPSET